MHCGLVVCFCMKYSSSLSEVTSCDIICKWFPWIVSSALPSSLVLAMMGWRQEAEQREYTSKGRGSRGLGDDLLFWI